MTHLKPLVQTSQLKTSVLAQIGQRKQQPTIRYDKAFDALKIVFDLSEQTIVAHYVDDHVALLYMADDLEIVGLQIEDFVHDFLPAHENVQRVWRLSGTGATIADMGDIIVVAQANLPKVAKEVAKATKKILGAPGDDLVAALA
jgi:hypothetical protein